MPDQRLPASASLTYLNNPDYLTSYPRMDTPQPRMSSWGDYLNWLLTQPNREPQYQYYQLESELDREPPRQLNYLEQFLRSLSQIPGAYLKDRHFIWQQPPPNKFSGNFEQLDPRSLATPESVDERMARENLPPPYYTEPF